MLNSFPPDLEAVVVGAGGGIGHALLEQLRADPAVARVHGFSRRSETPIELTDEASIAAAAEAVDAPRLVIVATGLLHSEGRGPEKRLADLDPAFLGEAFAVNAIGPALVMKHFAPRMPREGKAVLAVLTARVGSIADNRSGGWYGYRAAKAAANQLVRTAAIEIGARRPNAICVALHPGTVDTPLSAPFQRNVPDGKLFTPGFAASRLLSVIDGLSPADNGSFLAWDGQVIPF